MIGRYFRYELKKNLKTLGLLTAICTIIYVVVTSTADLFYDYSPTWIDYGTAAGSGAPNYFVGNVRNNSPQISIIYLLLGAMCFVVPALMYSFKMNRRSADAFYSLPIKREKLYLVKTLVGLILVFVPYTVAYVAGLLCIAFRENYYNLIWYLPGYFGGVFYGLCLYGIAAFSFARANRVADGVIFIIFYALVGLMGGEVLRQISYELNMFDVNESVFFPVFCFSDFAGNIDQLIRGAYLAGKVPPGGGTGVSFNFFEFFFPLLYTVAGFALLFLLPRFDKGEDAEQYSDSWFGYRVMIPLYTALFIALYGVDMLTIILFTVAAIVLPIIYRRKALFSWQYWVMIAVGALGGIVLNLIIF